MTLISLQALTWSTVAGVVVSALMLASSESAIADASRQPSSTTAARATAHSHGTQSLASRDRSPITKVVAPLSESAVRRETSAR
jgi:hypothetical protein